MRRVGIALVVIGLSFGCGGVKMPTQLPATVAGVDTDVRAGAIKALGLIQAAGEVAQQAQAVEAQLAAAGAIPAATHVKIQAAFKMVATQALNVITQIESGVVTSWGQLKAQIDPLLGSLNSIVQLVQAIGQPGGGLLQWLKAAVGIVSQTVPATAGGGA